MEAPRADWFGLPFEYVLFAATLLGVAVLHRRTLSVSLLGLAAITLYKLLFSAFPEGPGIDGLMGRLIHEWVVLANLGLLLTGFAILSRHFETSLLPDAARNILPSGWFGGFTILLLVFVISGVLDNIAGALIGAMAAKHAYDGRVSLAFLAAIVAASNAGGSGSVLGDTTTTMMWIAGRSPLEMLPAYIGAAASFLVFAFPAALTQQRHQPILKREAEQVRTDWGRIVVVAFILAAAIAANVAGQMIAPGFGETIPLIGMAVWASILAGSFFRKPDWGVLPGAATGTLFLLALVLAAAMMPIEALPAPSWETTFSLGFISAVFDNIPLTALALAQGGFDWALLAFAVGFGGSLVWFGSSAGVAVSNVFPESKSVLAWLRAAWWLPAAYVVGFLVMLGTTGWRPS